MKRFNFRIFLISSIIIVSAAYPCFDVAVENIVDAQDFYIKIAEVITVIFGFPILTITTILDSDLGNTAAHILLVVNCLLYGLLSERLFSSRKERTN